MREIAADRARLADLEQTAAEFDPLQAQDFDGSVQKRMSLQRCRERIRENIRRCYESAVAIQTYINSIEDSATRHIFTLYYIKGYTWRQVARELGCYDESVPRKKHDRYLLSYEGE